MSDEDDPKGYKRVAGATQDLYDKNTGKLLEGEELEAARKKLKEALEWAKGKKDDTSPG
jgi:hypothetical protein